MANPEPILGRLYHIRNGVRLLPKHKLAKLRISPLTEHVGWFRGTNKRDKFGGEFWFLRFELIATSGHGPSSMKGYHRSILERKGFELTEITVEDLPQFMHLPKKWPGFDRALKGE